LVDDYLNRMTARRRAQKSLVVVDISSDSSSQASENNAPEPVVDPNLNRHVAHYQASNPDAPDDSMNGKYGMFSLTPRVPKTVSAKRKRALRDGRGTGSNKKKSGRKHGGVACQRAESPLFEPEDGYTDQQDSDVEGLVMLTPSPTPTSSIRHKNGKGVATPTRDILIESSSSSSDSDADVTFSAPQHQDTTLKNPKDILTSYPLPGNASLVDESIDVLSSLHKHTVYNVHDDAIHALDREVAHLAACLASLPAEEAQLLAVIAHDCAKGIQADMASLPASADLFSVQAALERRNAEAETARQALPSQMRGKREELEAQKVRVQDMRGEEAVEAREAEETTAITGFKWRKFVLEREGGMVMAYELGRR
jgi:hypothetical protein